MQARVREKAAHRDDRGQEPERQHQRGPVNEGCLDGGVNRRIPSLLKRGEHDRGNHGERGGGIPAAREAEVLDEVLAQRRAKREPQVQRERIVADRLTHPARWRQVGDGREDRDEYGRFGDAGEQS